jgi:hypothetical protein
MQTYRAFVLRCWCEGETPSVEHSEWSFTISEIGGEQARHGFANLERLVIFLIEALPTLTGTGLKGDQDV